MAVALWLSRSAGDCEVKSLNPADAKLYHRKRADLKLFSVSALGKMTQIASALLRRQYI